MIIAISSILILTCFVYLLNKKLPIQIQICSICAGVSLTWLWMLLGMGYGLLPVEKYQLITAVLMGGSIVGITNKLQEKYKILKERKVTLKGRNNGKAEVLKKQLDDCC